MQRGPTSLPGGPSRATAAARQLAGALRQPQFARFVAVGLGGASLFLATSFLLTSAGMAPFWASIIAYTLAFLAGYLGQRFWTFSSRHRHGYAMPRYFLVQIACAFSCGLMAQGLVDLLGAPLWLMSVITTGFAGMVSFVASLVWVFPQGKGGA